MKFLRRYGLLAIPLVWLGVTLAMIDPGSLELRPDVPRGVSALFYDPTDIGAFVLRGANHSMGRQPGRVKEPPWTEPEELAEQLDAPALPYAAEYYLEYPSPTLLLFRLGFPTRCEMPSAVADCHHYGVAHFKPRTAAERSLWGQFHRAAIVHVALMTAALIGLMLVLRRGYEPGQPMGPVWLAVLPACLYFSVNRFDVVPALATALGFACLGRDRRGLSGVLFAFAALVKLYPVLFAPIILRYLGPRLGARWLAGFAIACAICLGYYWATLGWEPLIRPVQVQLARTAANDSWTIYGRLLPEALGTPEYSKVRLGILAALILLLVAFRPRDLTSALRRCLIVLSAFVAMATFWSPQWVIWFLPLVIPLAARHRWLAWVAAILDLANYIQFPIIYLLLWDQIPLGPKGDLLEGLVWTHLGAWCLFAAAMAWRELRPQLPTPMV
ncbi:MAG TPA: glycosyltransferase family 87 protein [Urbifossiella sp.]|nr:glycosyltransferase family 87 protein [Urbifossiella sp.]